MNAEIQFRTKYQPDYTGMRLRTFDFAEMEDHDGRKQVYALDLIDREGQEGARPVVIFIHGGGFTQPCDRRQAYISRFAKDLTAAGYAVVSPDYPIFDDEAARDAAGGVAIAARLPAEAVHLAYGWLRGHAGELALDMSRVAVAGGSAGGMTGFYAIAAHPEDRYRAFVNCWGAPEILPELAGFPPVLSIHGTADAAVPFALEGPVTEGLTAAGVPNALIALEGEPHTPLGRYGEFIPRILEHLARAFEA